MKTLFAAAAAALLLAFSALAGPYGLGTPFTSPAVISASLTTPLPDPAAVATVADGMENAAWAWRGQALQGTCSGCPATEKPYRPLGNYRSGFRWPLQATPGEGTTDFRPNATICP